MRGEIVDARPTACGRLAQVFTNDPWVGNALPATGFLEAQLNDLAATIAATACDAIVIATPVDVARLIKLSKPHCPVRCDLAEISRI